MLSLITKLKNGVAGGGKKSNDGDVVVVYQKTIHNPVTWRGIGVHSGSLATVTVLPAEQNSGITFYNNDYSQSILVGSVTPEPAMHATVIRNSSGWFVSTVEHLMAAFYVLGINNATIVIEGNEIPILDGSALPFFYGLSDAGIKEFPDVLQEFLSPLERIVIQDAAGRSIIVEPLQEHESGLTIRYKAIFDHPLIGLWDYTSVITADFFAKKIAPARTFGFVEQLPVLRKHGLARGASLGNTLVIAEDEIINDQRIEDECARHKLLDFIGDLALMGKPLVGKIEATKTGHSFNRLLIQHYKEHPTLWQVVYR